MPLEPKKHYRNENGRIFFCQSRDEQPSSYPVEIHEGNTDTSFHAVNGILTTKNSSDKFSMNENSQGWREITEEEYNKTLEQWQKNKI